jgi:hypothetical protein
MKEPDFYLPLNARSLRFRWLWATHDVSFDSQYVNHTVTSGGVSTTTKTLLCRLIDDFVVDMRPDYRGQICMRKARYALLAAVIFYFSVIPQFVPYLVPALLAYVVLMAIRGGPYVWPREQTRLLTDYASHVLSIPHLPSIEVTRQRFEEQLRAAIKESKILH